MIVNTYGWCRHACNIILYKFSIYEEIPEFIFDDSHPESRISKEERGHLHKLYTIIEIISDLNGFGSCSALALLVKLDHSLLLEQVLCLLAVLLYLLFDSGCLLLHSHVN